MNWNRQIGDSALWEIVFSVAFVMVFWFMALAYLYYPYLQELKRMNLTWREKLMVILGRNYLLNTRSGEVHNLRNKKNFCHSSLILRKNRRYMTGRQFHNYCVGTWSKGKPVNNCKWCNRMFESEGGSHRTIIRGNR